MAKKCIAYTRFSPRPDASTSESCERQLALIRSYAAAQSWEIVAEYTDAAASGKDHDRPGLWQAIGALRDRCVLLVYKLDRLSRDVYLSHILDRAIAARGAKLVSVTGEGTWEDSPENRLIRGILRQLDEYNRELIAARTSAVMRRHQAAGRKMGGTPPYGWQIDWQSGKNRNGKPGRLKRNEREQEIMQLAGSLATAGARICEIREMLIARGYKPRCGRKWHSFTIRRIIERATEAGLCVPPPPEERQGPGSSAEAGGAGHDPGQLAVSPPRPERQDDDSKPDGDKQQQFS